jgi:DnaK suppressor protein
MATLTDKVALDAGTLEMLRARLCSERVAATAAIESSKDAMASFLDARRGVEVDDEHDPEGATLGLQFAETSALLGNSRHHLDLVNAALGRMTNGTYGSCELCGIDIPLARLEARPFAAHCVRCAQVVGA